MDDMALVQGKKLDAITDAHTKNLRKQKVKSIAFGTTLGTFTFAFAGLLIYQLIK